MTATQHTKYSQKSNPAYNPNPAADLAIKQQYIIEITQFLNSIDSSVEKAFNNVIKNRIPYNHICHNSTIKNTGTKNINPKIDIDSDKPGVYICARLTETKKGFSNVKIGRNIIMYISNPVYARLKVLKLVDGKDQDGNVERNKNLYDFLRCVISGSSLDLSNVESIECITLCSLTQGLIEREYVKVVYEMQQLGGDVFLYTQLI